MSKSNLTLQPATLAAQALGWIDPTTRAITAPINLSTTFEREPDQSLPGGRSYIRPRAAAFDQPEALLAALEGGPAAMLFASGMAATTAVFQSPQARRSRDRPGRGLLGFEAVADGFRPARAVSKWISSI